MICSSARWSSWMPLLVLLTLSSLIHASPSQKFHPHSLRHETRFKIPAMDLSETSRTSLHILLRRDRFVIVNNSTVMNSATRERVPQGPATDAGGQGLDTPALIWVAFTLAVGVPMSLAGFRGWRVTTGIGVGLAGCLASWAAVINSIGPNGVTDLVITLISLGLFVLGFVFGVIPFGRLAGIFCIGFTGGMAFGIRIIIVKPGLLIASPSLYALNWVLIIAFGVAGAIGMVLEKYQRWSLLLGCASIGSFLTFLGIDLIINKQAGISRGLRYLFDRNASHFLDITGGGYKPPGLAIILIGVSLASTPILAFAQSRFFKAPFDRLQFREEREAAEDKNPYENWLAKQKALHIRK